MAEADEIIILPPDSDTTCSVCYAEFLEPEDLKVHITQVHLTETNKHRFCQFCLLLFSDVEDFAIHIRDVHLASLKCCKYCTRAYIEGDMLRRHESKHYTFIKKSMYSCSQCKEIFSNVYSLEQHEYEGHRNVQEGIMLHEYFPYLSTVLNIKAPTFLHSLCMDTAYVCVKCQMSTSNVVDYIEHLKKKNCRSIACDKCSNVYSKKYSLIKHFATSKKCQLGPQKEDLKKQCSKCLKEIDAASFPEHTKSCKAIKCVHCELLLDSVDALSHHQAKMHPMAIVMLSCNFCRRECVGTVALKKHVDRTHKPHMHLYKYKCVHCPEPKYYQHPKDLFAHFFSKHAAIHPYLCKICNKTFRIRKNFTIHIKLDHKSVGFVEFDENYHVFFNDKKSEKPFQPKCLFEVEKIEESMRNDELEEESVTDAPTDTENSNRPLKKRFQAKKSDKNVDLVNINSDFMNATETEGNQTEIESKTQKRLKKKRKFIKNKKGNASDLDKTESDDEPLVKIKKREKQKRLGKLRYSTWNNKKRTNLHDIRRRRFTCNICRKYCYTFQNYHHHVSLHFKDEAKKCIKCSKEFLNSNDLNNHMTTKHTTSKLTETLKNLLERRKKGIQMELSSTDKFQRTIKKAHSEPVQGTAVLREVNEKLSVKNFLESFTPEESTKEHAETVDIDTSVSVKVLDKPMRKKQVVRMTKFVPKPEVFDVKLAMPVKCCKIVTQPQKITVKLVQNVATITGDTYFQDEDNIGNDYTEDTDYGQAVDEDKHESVPEVAQEVMLEESEEPKATVVPHSIVLPKLPEYKQIKIAHLQDKAPFYKIVKIDEVLNRKKEPAADKGPKLPVKLPDGTKLVNVNPLAHLIGNRPVEDIIGPAKKSYYKPKMHNVQQAIAKALLKADCPAEKRRSVKKKAVDVEQ